MGYEYGIRSRIIGEHMKKVIQIGLPLLIILALAFPFFLTKKDVPIAQLQERITRYTQELQPQSSQRIESSYQLHLSNAESFIAYGPISYMNVEEITIFRQQDQTKRKELYQKAWKHIEQQKKSFEGYGITQMELLKKARVVEAGNYIFCVVGEHADEILTALKEE